MDFDELDDWQQLQVEETGGFTGLRRGCSLRRSELPPAAAARMAHLLAEIDRQPSQAPSGGTPDGQTLALTLEANGKHVHWLFDTADLPQAVSELMEELPPLRPLPPE